METAETISTYAIICYNEYSKKNNSEPLTGGYILGLDCLKKWNYEGYDCKTLCYAFNLQDLIKIVCPLIVQTEDEVKKFLSDRICQNNKIVWRPDPQDNQDVLEMLSGDADIVELLVYALFTRQYSENPDSFDHLVKIINRQSIQLTKAIEEAKAAEAVEKGEAVDAAEEVEVAEAIETAEDVAVAEAVKTAEDVAVAEAVKTAEEVEKVKVIEEAKILRRHLRCDGMGQDTSCPWAVLLDQALQEIKNTKPEYRPHRGEFFDPNHYLNLIDTSGLEAKLSFAV